MNYLLPVLSLALVVTVSGSPLHPDPGLTIDTLTQQTVHGTYYQSNSNLGIVFNSTTDSLRVTTLDGAVLIEGGGTENARTVNIEQQAFLQHSEHGDYALSKSHEKVLLEGFADVEQLLPLLEDQPHDEILLNSIDRLLKRPEMKLLKEAAESLGERGITGQAYPSILPFFMTSMRLSTREGPPLASYLDHLRLKRGSSCFDSCPPCRGEECLGLCGPGCECWKWACGDCCYHRGCHSHDLCCRDKPNSLACLVPLDFNCGENYKCGKN